MPKSKLLQRVKSIPRPASPALDEEDPFGLPPITNPEPWHEAPAAQESGVRVGTPGEDD